MSDSLHRIGLIVPSSNTTMETELPELFRWRSAATGERFTWHSARVSMARVTAEELHRMVEASDLAALSLADSPVDVIAYACLVAVMCRGVGAAAEVEGRLGAALSSAPRRPPVVSSAGALVDALRAVGASRVLSACVQMPSLSVVQQVEDELGVPVVTAATATARSILLALGLDPFVP